MYADNLSWTIERMLLNKAREKFNAKDFYIMWDFENEHWWLTFWDETEDQERQFDVVDFIENGKRTFDFKEL